MSVVRAVKTFTKYRETDKIEFYRNVIAKMTNNSLFPSPDVPIYDLTQIFNAFETAYIASRDGGATLTSKKNAAEAAADDAFRKTADYVTRVAAGNATTVLASGFELQKEPSPPTKPDFIVVQGKVSRTADASWKAIKGAVAYRCECALKSENPVWQENGISTKASYTYIDLVAKGDYLFRISAITKDGIQPPCDPFSLTVL